MRRSHVAWGFSAARRGGVGDAPPRSAASRAVSSCQSMAAAAGSRARRSKARPCRSSARMAANPRGRRRCSRRAWCGRRRCGRGPPACAGRCWRRHACGSGRSPSPGRGTGSRAWCARRSGARRSGCRAGCRCAGGRGCGSHGVWGLARHCDVIAVRGPSALDGTCGPGGERLPPSPVCGGWREGSSWTRHADSADAARASPVTLGGGDLAVSPAH